MKSSIKDDVAMVLTGMEAEGVTAISPDVITTMVIDSFGVHDSQDVRYQEAMLDYVRRIVSKMFNRYKVSDDPEVEVDGQLVLPGYERLQQRYLVKVGDESMAVRVHDLSDDQLFQKASEIRTMGEGCFLHAQEIERYIQDRSEGAVGL